jgi:uncharacterized protein (TIGR02270 family)
MRSNRRLAMHRGLCNGDGAPPMMARSQRGGPVERRPIRAVVEQHAGDAAVLYAARTSLSHAPHAALRHLRRFDDRLAAHLDGLSISGDAGWVICEAALEVPTAGGVFAAAVPIIESNRSERLDHLLALAEADPESLRGLMAAFGWIESNRLRGTVAKLLNAAAAIRQLVGVAACAMHRVDPGDLEISGLPIASPLRARRVRTAGELGRLDASRSCLAALDSDHDDERFWGAWSAALLGDRNAALDGLSRVGTTPGAFRWRAFRLALQVMDADVSRVLLAPLASDSDSLPWAIQGAGITGDASYVPWLLGHMSDDKLSRSAGEAFSLITGADLALLDLERKPPEGVESGPTDNPSDPSVDMDQDDGLPWPDPTRVESWWAEHQSRFTSRNRYFLGESVTRAHCLDVLKNGYQRQRVLAAHYLCLLEPGTVLFNTSAPAWRQQQLLAQMT